MKNQLNGNQTKQLINNRQIWIPGDVRSSKNSKIWTGKYLVMSKAATRYIKQTAPFWNRYKNEFIKLIEGKEYPLKIEFTFIRGSRQRFDYHNMVQLPLDLMQKYGWLEDDSATVVLPIFLPFQYDKSNPGLVISIK